jgi:hypothetical protein
MDGWSMGRDRGVISNGVDKQSFGWWSLTLGGQKGNNTAETRAHSSNCQRGARQGEGGEIFIFRLFNSPIYPFYPTFHPHPPPSPGHRA